MRSECGIHPNSGSGQKLKGKQILWIDGQIAKREKEKKVTPKDMPINKIFYLELVDDGSFGSAVCPKRKAAKDKLIDKNRATATNNKKRSGIFNKQ